MKRLWCRAPKGLASPGGRPRPDRNWQKFQAQSAAVSQTGDSVVSGLGLAPCPARLGPVAGVGGGKMRWVAQSGACRRAGSLQGLYFGSCKRKGPLGDLAENAY